MDSPKTHNNPKGSGSKVAMRRAVLGAVVAPTHNNPKGSGSVVLDVYCGPRGKMWREVWREATSYVGIDKVWQPDDKRRRFVGDSLVVLQHIDLAAFNVFDVDAFGAPWDALEIVARRRPRLRKGELLGLVATDGAYQLFRMGGMPRSLATLLGIKGCTWSAGRRIEAGTLRPGRVRQATRAGLRAVATTPRRPSAEALARRGDWSRR